MQQENISFHDWQQQYSSHEKCLSYIENQKWPTGFICSHCDNDHGYFNSSRHHYECGDCHKQPQ